ncbi:MAG: hypothetical protein VB124_04195 [Burkholderia sp.]
MYIGLASSSRPIYATTPLRCERSLHGVFQRSASPAPDQTSFAS